jgi:hypothetical protein
VRKYRFTITIAIVKFYRQSAADKPTTLKNGCDSGQKLGRILFENVSFCSVAQRLLNEFRLPFVGQENYFRIVVALRYPTRYVEAVQLWKTDVHQN